MSVRSEGTNAPLRRTDKKRIEQIKKRVKELIESGMSEDEASEQAHRESLDDRVIPPAIKGV